jgi:hypothetical protein
MRTRLLSLPLIALAGLLAVPEAGATEAAAQRRPAPSQLTDRDDQGRAARARPRDGHVDERSRRDDGWERRDARRGGRYEDRGRIRGDSRGWSRQQGFPFLGGGRGLELYELPRHSRVDARDLSRILGRNAFRRLEDESRRAGLRGPLHGVLSTRGRDLRLDISAGNVFVGRLIDRNGDWVIDEGRASEQFRQGRWRHR